MFPKFITKEIHAYLDYPVAFALIVLPFVLSLGHSNALALWLSVATGVAAFLLTVLTDHRLGLLKILPYNFHLTVDGLVGAAFVALPFVLGFSGMDFWFYLVNGLAVLMVVGLHKPDEEV